MLRSHQPVLVWLIWAVLVAAILLSVTQQRWSVAFVSLVTLGLSIAPLILVRRLHVHLPASFFAAIVVFLFASLFLGEVFDFYERYPWWDVLLHGGSAMGFGLAGFLFALLIFEGEDYAAPPIAMGFIGFCIAVSIGAVWEIFEFLMDLAFGLNMQKSGLMDTMWDLIVDVIGASIGGGSGYLYLKGWRFGTVLDEAVRVNRRLMRKVRRKD
ncbi:hypothetical protein [Aestuariibius sp. HNIBRBA575]|uniref:hypothetical protein n=1 Tax=Aestuariibius sp. HNIBRBA575 TaxID=3233343 RepID=UPI0034A51F92